MSFERGPSPEEMGIKQPEYPREAEKKPVVKKEEQLEGQAERSENIIELNEGRRIVLRKKIEDLRNRLTETITPESQKAAGEISKLREAMDANKIDHDLYYRIESEYPLDR